MTSTYSTSSLKLAWDEFTLTLQEGCYNNQLKMDGSLAHSSGGSLANPADYMVTSPATADTVLLPLYSSSLLPADCPLTATMFVWDDATNSWIDSTVLTTPPFVDFTQLDTGTTHDAGTLTISQESAAFISERIYKVKISITDLQSSDPVANAIEHVYTVDIYHACQRNTIAFDND